MLINTSINYDSELNDLTEYIRLKYNEINSIIVAATPTENVHETEMLDCMKHYHSTVILFCSYVADCLITVDCK